MCLDWMFCDCLLKHFKLMWNMSGLKLGEGRLQIYPRGTWSMSKNKPSGLRARNVWDEWSLWDYVHNTHKGVTKIGTARSLSRSSHFLGYFATVYSLIEALDFRLMVVDWGRWKLINLVTLVAFDAAWLIRRTAAKCKAYTPKSCQF